LLAMTSMELMQSELVIGWVMSFMVLHLRLRLLLPVLALPPSVLYILYFVLTCCCHGNRYAFTCKTAAEKRRELCAVVCVLNLENQFHHFTHDPFQLFGRYSPPPFFCMVYRRNNLTVYYLCWHTHTHTHRRYFVRWMSTVAPLVGCPVSHHYASIR
jgi:hypothetical protein